MKHRTCETIQKIYMEYIDGEHRELSPDVRRHISSCQECQQWQNYLVAEKSATQNIHLPERPFQLDTLMIIRRPLRMRLIWGLSFVSLLIGIVLGSLFMKEALQTHSSIDRPTQSVESVSIDLLPESFLEDPVTSPPDYIEQSGLWWQPDELEKLSTLHEESTPKKRNKTSQEIFSPQKNQPILLV